MDENQIAETEFDKGTRIGLVCTGLLALISPKEAQGVLAHLVMSFKETFPNGGGPQWGPKTRKIAPKLEPYFENMYKAMSDMDLT